MPYLTGQSIGRYHILEQLGEGGMAIVYKAYDTRLERNVAVKVLRTDLFGSAMLEQILKRFEREAKSLAKLKHSNIVNILDFGEHEGMPFLVMEYLPGGTLKQKLGRAIPWQQAIRILLPVTRGLAYAHQHGVIHRDVKPANILIDQNEEPILTDFGIAKLLEGTEGHTLTGSGVGIGTPEYMAPEQGIGAHTIDARADIYSLGIVFYEMVTGRKPYVADTPMAVVLKQMTDPLPRPTDFVPDLPEGVEHILFKALAKQPDDRYADMDALIAAMEGVLEEMKKVEAPAITKRVKKRMALRTKPSSKLAIAVLGALIIVLIIFIGVPSIKRQFSGLSEATSTFTLLPPTPNPERSHLDYYNPPDQNWSTFLDYFHTIYPGVNITSSWSEGDCFPFCSESSILAQRFQNGNQPDVLNYFLGYGFIKHWVAKGSMEPFSESINNSTLNQTYPKGFLELVSYEGHLWAAPSGVNRINLLWYNKTIFEQNGIQPADVESFEGFEKVAKKLQTAGIIPLAMSDHETWLDANLFGIVLAGSMSPEHYKGLWTGNTDWKDPQVAQALMNFQMMMKYTNADHAEITSDEFIDLFTEGKAAMAIQPSWFIGDILNKQFTDYGWTTSPGAKGVFVFMAWGMGNPKESPNPGAARQFQNVYASKEGSEIFLENSVTLCARQDCDYPATDTFRQSMNQDWQTDILVPSLLWDTATDSDWSQKITSIIDEFMVTGNIHATQEALLQACVDAGACKK